MKKFLLFLIIILSLILVVGCKKDQNDSTKNSGAKQKLYIFNWTYYTPAEVIKGFEEKYNVEVVYDEFASNEEMFTKLKAGGTGYDITFPSGDYVSVMINQKMIEKLDKSKIPNFKNIDPEIIKDIKFDPNNEYSIPYMKGASGISVNTKFVKNYKKDMSIFLRKDLKGRMTLLDDMREVLGYALKTLGYSVNSTNENELNKAKELVLKWKENIQKFDSESFGKAFASEEFWVVHGYEENVFQELEEKQKSDVDFFIPTTGGPMYMDSMVILKDSKNKDLAYKFINYIHEPEVYAKFVDTFSFPCINVKARDVRKVKAKYELSDLKNCEFKEDLGDKLELYNKIWQEIRVGN
jgi:spermidine/putrescine transport system substrate-binding protein